MLHSLYPTDDPALRRSVALAAARAGRGLVFTSLHIPESSGLRAFGAELAGLHRELGIEFCADVSPKALALLGVDLAGLGMLRAWGVTTVRIDFGFSPDEVRAIAAAGPFRIAVNASTVTPEELDELAGLDPVGWHNYYPRPETGLSEDFFAGQNALLRGRGHDVVTFIPGEREFRAPLQLGLPTLESHRHANAYVNHARVLAACPDTEVACAEGTVLPQHEEWIERRERHGEIVVPLASVPGAMRHLLDGPLRLRPEGTAASHRIEGTRGGPVPPDAVNGTRRSRGSLQVDVASMGRYRGEVHLMREDLPLTAAQVRVAEIAGPYTDLVDLLRPGQTIRFVVAPAVE
ncbi:MupG family TIM beta-alpha barrel fold protein [Tsukamurella sp. M9C]|uniref:MupG family TIM beta-alpha barrel fold protein n=1 Tax=Tsukamurella sp. M9C TaxID=2877520 RepID=UPI001CCD11E6|nr:MupG family TIM beta-alpha barrel fold protein [Tsukamurella sp. M9C]MCA0156559.1 MupG family TIM beta-alpha barrel fold protein [Tsukamurella sp. M9C]